MLFPTKQAQEDQKAIKAYQIAEQGLQKKIVKIETDTSLKDITIRGMKRKAEAQEESFNKQLRETEISFQAMQTDLSNLMKDNTQLQVRIRRIKLGQ